LQLPSLCASLWFCFELLSLFPHVFLKSVGWSKELGFCSLPAMFLFNWKVKPVPVACPKTVTSCSFLVSQWWIQLKLRLSLSFLLAHRFARQFFSFFSSISISCSSVHVQLVWNSYLCVCACAGVHMCISMCPFKDLLVYMLLLVKSTRHGWFGFGYDLCYMLVVFLRMLSLFSSCCI
jgi:hypothetical protein